MKRNDGKISFRFIPFLLILFFTHCVQKYYYPIKTVLPDGKQNTQTAWQSTCHTLPVQMDEKQGLKPNSACVRALLAQFPVVHSFSKKPEEAEEARLKLATLFAWVLSIPPLQFPIDGLILGQPGLKIPDKYECIFTPEKKAEFCQFQSGVESLPTPTLNERLVQYLFSVITDFIYIPKPLSAANQWVPLVSKAQVFRGKGELRLYPPFWKTDKINQLAFLFKEVQNFYSNGKQIVCSEKKGEQPFSCDKAAFHGPLGAQLVISEIFRQTLLQEVKQDISIQNQSVIPSLGESISANKIDRLDWICQKKGLCMEQIFKNYCFVYNHVKPPFSLPVEMITLCSSLAKGEQEYIEEFQRQKEMLFQK